MRPTLASLLITAALGASAAHADGVDLTLYHSDDNSLFSAGDGASVDAGYAVVHEPRQLSLSKGVQELRLDDLPAYLDGESLSLNIPGGGVKVLSQRLNIGQGQRAALSQLVGQNVSVYGAGGQVIANGKLLNANDGLLIQDNDGTVRPNSSTLVHDYAAVRANSQLPAGPSLSLHLDANRAGSFDAELSYPTSGLGWRAAYVATLQPGNSCRFQLESRASIANRSGRDWKQAQLKLVAGQPRIGGAGAPRPVMMMARAQAADSLPSQASLGDYRSFTLPAAVDLPDGSISQAPLYATRAVDCERVALIESGNPGWAPDQPDTSDNAAARQLMVNSNLSFKAFDNLPAGKLRVLQIDHDGHAEFVGEGQLGDTPKGLAAKLVLGQVFDLQANRERTAFKVDKAGRSIDEAFRLTVSNSGDSARSVTLREYPNRWREWTLSSSSSQPSQRKTNLLEFKLEVPAHGQASLDYALHYHWSAPQD